ncbi:MAG: amino acid racemase [Candidatus Aminicenantes bacterium]|nr:MAG: amino acid racemase [Candidatus Aminicenantes bacterium]
MKKTIGILGGMGPEVTAYFYEQIVKQTKAETDQDHIKALIYSNPKIPPRTDAILKTGPSPTPLILEGFQRLKDSGADFVVMPCVTAHYFYPEVQNQVNIPLISLLDEAVKWAQIEVPELNKAGLVASTGTLESRLFHDAFGKAGIGVIHPEEDEQNQVMEAIFGPKGIKSGFTSGFPKETLASVAKILIARGADAIIAGCTEVPLVLKDQDIPVPLIEPLRITARACIIEAGYEPKD